MIGAQLLQYPVVVVIERLGPDLGLGHVLDGERHQDIGLQILADRHHHRIAFMHAEVAQGIFVARIGHHRLRDVIGWALTCATVEPNVPNPITVNVRFMCVYPCVGQTHPDE